MINNNDFEKEKNIENKSLNNYQSSDMLSVARAKFAEFRTTMLEQRGESKAKMQKAKLLLNEAKSIEKVKKSKEKELDSVFKRELATSAKADKELEKVEAVFDKLSTKRQVLETIALTESIKREDIEKNLEVLNLQEEALSQDIQLTNELLVATSDAKSAKELEIDLKNSRYARAVLSDAHTEADRLAARIEDEKQLKKLKFSSVLSDADEEGIQLIEQEKQRLIAEAEAVYLAERQEILDMSDDDITEVLRSKLLKKAEDKLKEELVIIDGMAEVMLKDFALDKLAAAREAIGGDITSEKSILLEKISAISEEERFRIMRDRKETLARIQREKDEGVEAIIEDDSIPEDKKEAAINKLIKDKQLEAKEAIRQFKYEEKARILAGKAEVKIAFKHLSSVQSDIAKLKYKTILDSDSELESLDLLISETASKAETLAKELDTLRRDREEKDRNHLRVAAINLENKMTEIENVYEDIQDFNAVYMKEVDESVAKIQANTDINKIQDRIDLAKQFAIQERKELLDTLREQQIMRAAAKGQITQAIAARQMSLTDEERKIIAEKRREILNNKEELDNEDEDIDAKIENTTKKLSAEDFVGDLLSLEDLAELEALEAELSILEEQKKKELHSLEQELLLLEESQEQELERLRKESEQLKEKKRDGLNQLEAEVAALEDQKRKQLAELDNEQSNK